MNIYMAPLEGITGYIYRNAYAQHFGSIDKYYAPFVSTHTRRDYKEKELRDILPENNQGLQLVPQILTNDAHAFVELAGQMRHLGYEEINLNLGCPSKTVVGKNKGGGALRDTEWLTQFLDTIFDAYDGRVSIKTRIGMWDKQEWEEIVERYAHYPIDELIIHPRCVKDYYTQVIHPETYGYAKNTGQFKSLCYNGDIRSLSSYRKLAKLSGLDDTREAVMLGRGLMRNPFLPELLRGNAESVSMERFVAFHDRLYEDYSRVQSGETNILHRMKELWTFWESLFEDAEGEYKQIKKSQHLWEYENAVRTIFREKRMKDDE